MPSSDQPRPQPAEWISTGLVDEAAAFLICELLKRSAKATQAENASLWLVKEESLAAVLGIGPHADFFVNRYEQPLQQGIISLVYASGQPIFENAISDNPNHSKVLDNKLGITSDAMIAAPVTALGEIVGVVTCVHTRPVGTTDEASRFKPRDLGEFEFAAACTGRILDSALLGNS
jgi:hypothetical protein